jgi:hypothetical protein
MKTLRIDAWCYKAGMAISAVVVAVAIPVGVIVCILWLVNLL